jgi:hypothetical protein
VMRSSLILALGLIGLFGVFTFQANARPNKIDYHSGICQKMAVIGAGGAGGGAPGPSLTYSSMGVKATGGDISIVCPLQHVTFNEDTSSGPLNLTVTAKVLAWPGTTSICDLRSENTGFVSIPVNLTGLGSIPKSNAEVLPTNGTGNVSSMRFLCTNLKMDTQLGTIQIQIDP